MSQTCLLCGEPLTGRIDKKFCDDHCRNQYNNQAGRAVNNLIRKVNRKLAINRKILANLNPTGKSKTTEKILHAKGFDFNHFTEIYETQAGKRYFFCYEQGYLFLPERKVALVVKKDYVNQPVPRHKKQG
ncbi:MAG: hypothetical protein U5L96_22195 [Owenweeksia sp.]|nr:hypothetical protein [Owenweeksia sp.]